MSEQQIITSSFADDPVMSELVEMYVGEMPERISGLENLRDSQQWEELRRSAHQLKGSGQSYGFEPITQYAARLERSLRESEPEEQVMQQLTELLDVMHRVH